MYYFDVTYLLVLIGIVLCLGASALVNVTMKKYRKVPASTGMTGSDAAYRILQREGLRDVNVVCLQASDGDHYDPRNKQVCLSYENFYGSSVTAVAVAAHECGHAIQHAEEYVPLGIRSALVPVVNIASNLGMPIIFLGVLLSWNQFLIQLGIIAFASAVVFQLVTLPVEFNASFRAVGKISEYGLLTEQENRGTKRVLTAAALTYVAATASSILQLLRLILIFGGGGSGRRRR
ncbi:MAG: zinc metallopeptidase [Lachnospiraceae bacterium]|nr:zinc metallopeptidase [Lachnospiraceae bacterium]